jgi:hypothetical protein
MAFGSSVIRGFWPQNVLSLSRLRARVRPRDVQDWPSLVLYHQPDPHASLPDADSEEDHGLAEAAPTQPREEEAVHPGEPSLSL